MFLRQYVVYVFLIFSLPVQTQTPGEPNLWILPVYDSEVGVVLTEKFSGKMLHQIPASVHCQLNYNPAVPVFQGDHISMALPFLPKTVVSVLAVDDGREQVRWTISEPSGLLAVMTNKRMADLQRYAYMNFPDRPFRQPILSTYVYEESHQDTAMREYLFRLGHSGKDPLPVEPFAGNIAEVLLYDRILSNEERNIVESYLAIKYGLTLNAWHAPHYVNGHGSILWDGLLDKDYSNRIAGIGRDDHTGLYQRQSTSSIDPGTVVISAGPITSDNTSHSTALPQGAFLLWGDNDTPMALEEEKGSKLFFQRKWKVSVTNWKDSLTTSVIFDRAALNTFLNTNEMYWLVIDREGNGKFSGANLEFYPGNTKSRSVEFIEVIWDPDNSGADHFALMIAPEVFAHVDVLQPTCGSTSSGAIDIRAVGGIPPYQFSVQGPSGYLMHWTSRDNTMHRLESLDPGLYTIRLSDSRGVNYEEVQIVAHGPIANRAIDKQYFLPEEGTLRIDLSGLGFDALSWHLPGGHEVSGQSLVVTGPGQYAVFGESNGCVFAGTIDVHVLTESPFMQCSIYPNPTPTGEYHLHAELSRTGDLDIAVHTPAGAFIERHILRGRQNYTFRGRLTGGAGAYLITVGAHGHAVSLPLIYR